RPESATRLIYPALDLGAAGDEHRQRELAYLAPAAAPPAAVLGRWERELAGPGGETAATGRARAFLGPYCRRGRTPAPRRAGGPEFVKCWRGVGEKVVRANPSGDPGQAEDRERVLRWVDSHQALAQRLECGECFVEFFRGFLAAVREKLLAPWDRNLGRRR